MSPGGGTATVLFADLVGSTELSRLVQRALAVRDGVRLLGLEIRAGLHTGECEVSGIDVAGMAVQLAVQVEGRATAGEIPVSGTVRGLVTGSGLSFADRGGHWLKGIDGEWAAFAVVDER